MKIALYIIVVALLTPLFLVGLLAYMIPILLNRGRVSGTTYEPFNARLMYHCFGSRPDPAALKLSSGLPATNAIFMALMLRPLVWASRVSGYVPTLLEYPPPRPTPLSALIGARCEFLDNALLQNVSAGDQVVILGAGWDTRAYGLLKGQDVALFEVDAPATQAVKLAAIHKTGLDASHVTFVSCDFNRQSWLEALIKEDFDPRKRTFILWEGVTMYLEEQAVQTTFRAVSTLAPESHIACDFFSREWLENTVAGKIACWAVKANYGEPFIFGFPVTPNFSERLRGYLDECHLTLDSHRPLGNEAGLPYGGLMLAVNSPGNKRVS